MLASAGEEEKKPANTLDRNHAEAKMNICANITAYTHNLFTSMWEELGVYLLEGVFIYDTTWTLLERERDKRTQSETHVESE